MSRFLQLHLLTFYPPANLNRDDAGRPKSAVVGGVPRLRISSQSLKRAWRTSDVFKSKLDGHLGIRTLEIGDRVQYWAEAEYSFDPESAAIIGRCAAAVFGTIDEEKTQKQSRLSTKQLVFISADEVERVRSFLEQLKTDSDLLSKMRGASSELTLEEDNGDEEGNRDKKKKKQSKTTAKLLKDLRDEMMTLSDGSVDVAMFGRMLAGAPKFNREAAVQVAHAITTHKAIVEDDYYVAVDDLNTREENMGAGLIGEAGFGSGIFYLYICIDLALLRRNLGGDGPVAAAAVAALAEAAATVAPGGKQASFASRARAHFILAESGDAQPRTLAGAFLTAAPGEDPIAQSVARLIDWRDRLDGAYGPAAEATQTLDVNKGEGSLADILGFCRQSLDG